MRVRWILHACAVLSVALVVPASAKVMQKAPTTNFAANCARKAPNATCRCIIAKLAATIDGNFIMEVAAVSDRYSKGTPKEVMLAVINRYDLTYPEFKDIAQRSDAILSAAGRER